MNFKELSLTLKVGAKWWSGTCFGVSAFRAGSPFTTLGPVSLVSEAKDALFETTKVKYETLEKNVINNVFFLSRKFPNVL